MKAEDQQMARFCISRGYLNQKDLQMIYDRLKALESRGVEKRLIQLIAETLHWP